MHDRTIHSRQTQLFAAGLALALWLSWPAPVFAQDRGEPAASAETRESTAPDGPDRSDNSDNDNDDGAASERGVVLSPFDYEASESISEDSSVSFPVDI